MEVDPDGSFICCHCYCGFDDKHQLEVHLKIEHGQIVYGVSEWYACKDCLNALYARSQDIVKHARKVHNLSTVEAEEYLVKSTADVNIPCNVCGKISLLSKFCTAHLDSLTVKKKIDIPCEFCNESFLDDGVLEAHATISHGKLIYNNPDFKCYACKICRDQLFVSCDTFIAHLRDVHKYLTEESELDDFVIDRLDDIVDLCQVCGVKSVFFKFCRLHNEKIAILNCNKHADRHICAPCEIDFNNCKDLWDHNFSSHRKEKLICNLCDKSKARLIKCPSNFMGHCRKVHRNTQFWDEADLLEKSKVVTGNEARIRYQCPECISLYDAFEDLKTHLKCVHDMLKSFVCVLCSKSFRLAKNLRDHERNVHKLLSNQTGESQPSNAQNKFICDLCSKSFRLPKHLRDHERNVHKIFSQTRSVHSAVNAILKKKCMFVDNGEVKFKCTECDKIVSRVQTLREHITSVHENIKDSVCSICGKAFTAHRRLTEHMRRKHTPLVVKKEGTLLEETGTKFLLNVDRDALQVIIDNERKYKCPICNEIYSRFSELKHHLIVHAGEESKNFACTYCDLTFFWKSDLEMHYKRAHQIKVVREATELRQKTELTIDGVTKYKCPQCPSISSRFDTLRNHLKVHSGEKPFSCEMCGKSFAVKRRLSRHVSSIHMGVRFQCNICGRVLTDSSNLKVHMRNHTGEKKYVCEVCGKCFNQWSSHYYHKFSHSKERQFQCPHCDLKYNSPKTLYEHKKTHAPTDVKHVCDLCGADFRARKNLTSHKRIHTLEKPHVCEMCNARFKMRKYLVQHYKTHAKNK